MSKRNRAAAGFAVAFALTTSVAFADGPVVALHPLLIVGDEAAEPSQAASLKAAAAARFTLAPDERVSPNVSSDPGCATSDDCLATLAERSGADATLLVSASPYSPTLVVTARLISRRGSRLVAPISKELPRGASLDQGFGALLDEVRVASAAAWSKPEAPVATGPSARQVVGIGAGVAGVAALGFGGFSMAASNGSWAEFNQAYANGALPSSSEVPRLTTLSDRARSQQTLGVVGLASGAALLGTGAWLLFAGGETSTSASVVVTPAGSAVILSWELP